MKPRSKPLCPTHASYSPNWHGLLGGQSYLTGDSISLADLLVAPGIAFFTATPEWRSSARPRANLVAWLERMEARPSMKATTWERVSEMAKAA